MGKILILTEGGGNIGFGHITRCKALYQALTEKDVNVRMVVAANGCVFDLISDLNAETLNWLDSDKTFDLAKDVDAVIVDSYLAPQDFYEHLSEVMNGRMVVLDDYMRLDYAAGLVINPSIYGQELKYKPIEGIQYLLGCEYVILRKEFWPEYRKVINEKVKNVLVTFGGTATQDFIDGVVDMLKDEVDLNCNVVGMGKLYSTALMKHLMQLADICISGGGQTTYELAHMGVPTIAVCFADNQKFNLQTWQEMGVFDCIGWYNDKDFLAKLKTAVNKLADFNLRRRISEAMQMVIDGKGTLRIAAKIKDYVYAAKD